MSENLTKGLTLADAHKANLAELAGSAPDAATEGEGVLNEPNPTEHPAVESEGSGDVDLLAALDESAEDVEEGEQPDEDSLTFTVKGKPVSVSELKNGYLRQSDYTKKTQELATEKEEVKNAVALWEAMRDDPVGTLRQLQQGIPIGKSSAPAKPQGQDDIEARIEAAVEARLQSDPRLQEIEQKAAAQKEADAFKAVEADFNVKLSDNDRVRVRDKMGELGLNDPAAIRTVFASLYSEAQLAAQRRKNIAATSTPRSRPGNEESPTVETKLPKSIFEAFEMEKAEAKAGK